MTDGHPFDEGCCQGVSKIPSLVLLKLGHTLMDMEISDQFRKLNFIPILDAWVRIQIILVLYCLSSTWELTGAADTVPFITVRIIIIILVAPSLTMKRYTIINYTDTVTFTHIRSIILTFTSSYLLPLPSTAGSLMHLTVGCENNTRILLHWHFIAIVNVKHSTLQ